MYVYLGIIILKFTKSVLYAHKVHTTWWDDINKPEQFGFASMFISIPYSCSSLSSPENQITPFNISTPDNETIYAWHVVPLGLYAKHEKALLSEPSGCAEDITSTKAFELLTKDPDARLIINCKYRSTN